MAIVLRCDKNIALTHEEMDNNICGIDNRICTLETSASASIANTDINNWNCAYNWGDHACAGYCTTETSHADVVVDGDFTSAGLMTTDGNGAYNITTNNSSNWDTAYGWGDYASAGYLTSETDSQTLCLVGTDLSISNGNTVDLCGIGGTSYTDSDVDTHLNTSSASCNQILSWNGTDYTWVADQTSSGSGTVVAPFAFVRLATTSNGSGTGMSWSNWDSNNGTMDFTFDSAQSDTDYIVVTDGESNDDGRLVSIQNKTVNGFEASFYDPNGVSIPSGASAFTIMVYGSTPTQTVLGNVQDFAYSSLTGTPTIPADVSDLTDTTSLLVHYTDSDVDTHLNTSTASPNEVLSWTGSVYDWVPQSGGGSADLTWTITKNSFSTSFEFSGPGIETGNTFNPELQLIRGYTYKFSDTDNPTTLEIRTSENGSAYTPGVTTSGNLTTFTVPYDAPDTLYYETTASSLIHGVIKIVNANNGLQSRTTVSGSAFIPPGPQLNVDITGYKGYNLYKITTSVAARVIVYTSDAARTADAGRAEGTDPTPNSGVIAEVITTGAETVTFSPGVIGYNDENPVTNTIPIRLQNKTASSATTTATLTVVQTEV